MASTSPGGLPWLPFRRLINTRGYSSEAAGKENQDWIEPNNVIIPNQLS